MKRVRTMTVLALGWLSSTALGDDLGWKTAEVPPPPKAVEAPPPLKLLEPLPAPKVVEAAPATPMLVPESTDWKAGKPIVPAPNVIILPEPVAPDILFRPVAPAPVSAPPAPPPVLTQPPLTQPATPSGLEPLAPPNVLPPLDSPTPSGPRVRNTNLPSELPALPTPELPKLPPTEALPAPRPAPGPDLHPKPICNDTPSYQTPSATLQKASAVAPAEAGIPVRRGTFGSPGVQLSRDYSFRDLFGLDLMRNERAPRALSDGLPEDRLFVQAEYLYWWANQGNIPVLATTNTTGAPGYLGQPGTQSLLGPGTFGPTLRDGFRARAGGYLDECGMHGVDVGFFFLGRRSESFSADSSQYPVITRPFFAPNFGTEFGEIVAQPGLSSGRLDITSDSFLWGADINYRTALCRTCDRTTGWFVGYRHLNLTETLTIAETITSTGALSPDPVGTKVFVQDRFEARNRFHGAQVGGFWNRKFGSFDLDVRAGLSMGVTQQTLQIDGIQQRTRPGEATQTFTGGLLATGPNLGTFTQNHFSVVPEITTNLGYRITPNLRLYVGYNFLYWSNVVRPGDAIDRTVDVALVPNPPAGVAATGNPRPQPVFRQSDFWAQGIQFGVELRW